MDIGGNPPSLDQATVGSGLPEVSHFKVASSPSVTRTMPEVGSG